ncbi:hypothetical protein [Myxacorys almedinensis]|uniref:Uncharacterized protein n=1 Tax=Myxacorys almedinensis A TaxID=2690445 RepID=A0A8J8CN70_9CYAN|nr:hypothetical protein [Myxacorys almedinensis]NDJ19295.1 hypothetical protein [Myxacorys almedinensis A]
MVISDLSYLETAENTAIAGGNYAHVDQDADAYAGNNSSYYWGGNISYGNVAVAANVSSIYQKKVSYGFPYFYY